MALIVARCDPTPVLDAPRTQIDPAFAGPIGEERLLFCPRDLGGKPRAVKRRLTPGQITPGRRPTSNGGGPG